MHAVTDWSGSSGERAGALAHPQTPGRCHECMQEGAYDACRVRMSALQTLGGHACQALSPQVCARFAPVLHHFFLEHYREPAAWFERRLAYTRATAVNSMAGYVIGLGDRHSHNILIHTRTAEARPSAHGIVTLHVIWCACAGLPLISLLFASEWRQHGTAAASHPL